MNEHFSNVSIKTNSNRYFHLYIFSAFKPVMGSLSCRGLIPSHNVPYPYPTSPFSFHEYMSYTSQTPPHHLCAPPFNFFFFFGLFLVRFPVAAHTPFRGAVSRRLFHPWVRRHLLGIENDVGFCCCDLFWLWQGKGGRGLGGP